MDRQNVEPPPARDRVLPAGATVGKFRIEEKIGEGGFGTVYRAVNDIDKVGAVKVLNLTYSTDPEMVSRFKAEARAVNQIRHQNIIDIFEFGELEDGRQYYIMEYLDGMPMDQFLTDRGRVSIDEALPIFRSIARALDAAHEKGIAHRDLKPENIFLVKDAEGRFDARLLDFGIAKLMSNEGGMARHKTRTGAPIGTPYYMSPEQCRGRDVDHRTDLYAFGCVVYQTLTGRFAFDGPDVMDILVAQMQTEPPPPSAIDPEISPFIDEAVAWLLRKNPADRPPKAMDAISVLEGAASPEVALRGYTPSYISSTPHRVASAAATAETVFHEDIRPHRTRRWVAVLAVLAGALVVGLALARGKSDAPRKAAVAAPLAKPTPLITPPTKLPPSLQPPSPTPQPTIEPAPAVQPKPRPKTRPAKKRPAKNQNDIESPF